MWLSSQAVPSVSRSLLPTYDLLGTDAEGPRTPTCPVLLVTAAPLVPTIDARVVRSQESRVVDAHLTQCRQPLVQLIHTLWGQRLSGQSSSSPRRKPFPEPPPQPSQALYFIHIKLEQPGKREVKKGAAAIRLTRD